MTPKTRPAETGTALGGLGLLIGRLAGIKNPDTLTELGVLVAGLPAAITWAVTLLRGR